MLSYIVQGVAQKESVTSRRPLARTTMMGRDNTQRVSFLVLCSVAKSSIEGEDSMNRYMLEKWPWIEGSHGMRSQLLDILSDADLAFSPGGQNITFGALCREMGEIEYSYVQSLKPLSRIGHIATRKLVWRAASPGSRRGFKRWTTS